MKSNHTRNSLTPEEFGRVLREKFQANEAEIERLQQARRELEMALRRAAPEEYDRLIRKEIEVGRAALAQHAQNRLALAANGANASADAGGTV